MSSRPFDLEQLKATILYLYRTQERKSSKIKWILKKKKEKKGREWQKEIKVQRTSTINVSQNQQPVRDI